MMPTATLKELREEFGRGGVRLADLVNPHAHIDGFCDFGSKRVYVNPKPSTVETLLHELLHRKYPRWSERRVDREAKELLARMSTRQVNAWYRMLHDAAVAHKTPKRIDDE